jgi:hypothetical protein
MPKHHLHTPRKTVWREATRRTRHTLALTEVADQWNSPDVSRRELCRSVAAKYPGEKADALRRHLERHGGELSRTDDRQLFSDQQEQVFLGIMRTFSIANHALSRVQTIEMVRDLNELPQTWNGENWYRSFVERHSDLLHPMHPQLLAPKRTNPELPSKVQAFVAGMERFHAAHYFGADATYSADETFLSIKMVGQASLRLEAVGKVNRNYVFPKGLHYGSIIPFSNAAGHTALVVLVLPLQLSEVETRCVDFYLPQLQPAPKDHMVLLYAFTSTGRMNTQLFRAIMQRFVAIVQVRSPGVIQQLYLDRLGAHLDRDMVAEALQHGVYINWYPPECSAFLQPCDNAEFAVFHNTLNKLTERFDLSRLVASLPSHAIVLAFLQEALKACTASNVVKVSFARTGIFPWNKELILSNAKNYLDAEAVIAGLAPVIEVIQMAECATLSVLERHQIKHEPKRLRARPELQKVYTGEELLEMHEKKLKAKKDKAMEAQDRARRREAKAVALKAEKDERRRQRETLRTARKVEEERKQQARQMFSCKACGCTCRSRKTAGVTSWIWCSYCDEFAICPYRRLCADGPETLRRHEEEEVKRKKRALPGAAVSLS